MIIGRLVTIFAVAASTLTLTGCVVEETRYVETRNPRIDRGYGGYGGRAPVVRPNRTVVVEDTYTIRRDDPRVVVGSPPPPPSVYDDRGYGDRGYGGRNQSGSRGHGGFGGSVEPSGPGGYGGSR